MHPSVRTILEKFFEFEVLQETNKDEYLSKMTELSMSAELLTYGIYKDILTRENSLIQLEPVDIKILQLIYILIIAKLANDFDYNNRGEDKLKELVKSFNQEIDREQGIAFDALRQLESMNKQPAVTLKSCLKDIGINVDALKPKLLKKPPRPVTISSSQDVRVSRKLFPADEGALKAPPPSEFVKNDTAAAENRTGYGQVVSSHRNMAPLISEPKEGGALSDDDFEPRPAPPPVNTATSDKLPEESSSFLSDLARRRAAVNGESPEKAFASKAAQTRSEATTDENRKPLPSDSRTGSLSQSASAAERPALFADIRGMKIILRSVDIVDGDQQIQPRGRAKSLGGNAAVTAGLFNAASKFIAQAQQKTPPRDSQDDFTQSFTPTPSKLRRPSQ